MVGIRKGGERVAHPVCAPIRQMEKVCGIWKSKLSQVSTSLLQLSWMEDALAWQLHIPLLKPLQSRSLSKEERLFPKQSLPPQTKQSQPTASLISSPTLMIMLLVLVTVGLGRYQQSFSCKQGPQKPPQTLELTPSNIIVPRVEPRQVETQESTWQPAQREYCLLRTEAEKTASAVKKHTSTKSPPSQSSPLVFPRVRGSVSWQVLLFEEEVTIWSMLVMRSLMSTVGLPEAMQQSSIQHPQAPPEALEDR